MVSTLKLRKNSCFDHLAKLVIQNHAKLDLAQSSSKKCLKFKNTSVNKMFQWSI